jgi:hypothetical protein
MGRNVTIGRIVLVSAYNTMQICPAIVTQVHGYDGRVNLTVFPDCGPPYPMTYVTFSEEPQYCCWHWPTKD